MLQTVSITSKALFSFLSNKPTFLPLLQSAEFSQL